MTVSEGPEETRDIIACGDIQSKENESFLPMVLTPENVKKGETEKDDTPVDYKSYSLIKRLKYDLPYKRRFIHTLWLFLAFIGLGFVVGQIGPAFPDLRHIANQTLDSASWIFSLGSIGYLFGSLFGGFLYDRFNKLLLICFSCILMAVPHMLIPWIPSFTVMLVCRFLSGLGSGGLDTGGNADLVSIWDKEGRSFMQALHFFFGFGAMISPLITEPFLAKKTEHCGLSNDTASIIITNYTDTQVTMATVVLNVTENVTAVAGNVVTCQEDFGVTYIHYAFLISGIVLISGAIPFLVMYIKILRSKNSHEMSADKSNTNRPNTLPLKLKVLLLILLSGFMSTYCAVEDTFGGFLMTFCITYLKWGKDTGSWATSLHWTAFSVGRFSGIFLIRFFKPVQLLSAYTIFLMCSFLGMLIVCLTDMTDLVWIFIPLCGFSMSIIFACIFTWTEESILEVTGMISSMFLISASLGLMINPLFLGNLMDHITPMWFVYLLLSESVVCFLFFVVIFIVVKFYVKPIKHRLNMEVIVPEAQPLDSLVKSDVET